MYSRLSTLLIYNRKPIDRFSVDFKQKKKIILPTDWLLKNSPLTEPTKSWPNRSMNNPKFNDIIIGFYEAKEEGEVVLVGIVFW